MMKQTLLSLIVLVSGCSRLDFAMKWADTFVMASVTDYFDLTSQQDEEARGDFKKALVEVQKQDFPIFSAWLFRFSEEIEFKKMTDKKMDVYLEEAEKNLRKSLARFEPMAQNLVIDQIPSNFKMFDKEFLRKHDKDIEKAKDESEQLRKAKKNIEKFVDETVGYLREEQRKEIESQIREHPFPAILQVESRKAMFEKFKQIRNDSAKRKDYVNKYFLDWESLQTAEYKKARSEALSRFKVWIKNIVANLDDKQRDNLIRAFRGRAEELKKISEK